MSSVNASAHQSHRLLQIGIGLILYLAIEGFAIPYAGSPRIGLSVHTLSIVQANLFLALGLLWPRLALGRIGARVAFGCLVYSALAILAAYSIAAVWGVGSDTIVLAGELPHGLHQGSVVQESFIKVLAYSSAPTGLIAFTMIFWGLRAGERQPLENR